MCVRFHRAFDILAGPGDLGEAAGYADRSEGAFKIRVIFSDFEGSCPAAGLNRLPDSGYRFTTMATASPPPRQREASLVFASRRIISWRRIKQLFFCTFNLEFDQAPLSYKFYLQIPIPRLLLSG